MKNQHILDKYLFMQVFGATLVCILLFSIIWIAPEILLKTVQRVLNGTYTIQMGISVILSEIPKILGNALPVGIFLGTLFTFDKMSKDSEITIMRACGASFYRIIASSLVLGVLIAFLNLFVQDRMIPYASFKYSLNKQSDSITHFVFPIKTDEGKMKRVIIVPEFYRYSINDAVVLNFTDKNHESGKSVLSSIYMADYVKYNEKTHDWIIHNAATYEVTPEGVYIQVATKNNIKILGGERGQNAYELMKFSQRKARDFTNKEIKRYISMLKQESMDDEYRFMLNKYLGRFSQSFIAVLFVVFGALLGFSKPRDQRLVGFTLAVLTVFLYYITMPFLDLLAEKGIVHPVITAFIAPVLLCFAIKGLKKHKDL